MNVDLLLSPQREHAVNLLNSLYVNGVASDQSETGTGKTLGFGLPIVNYVKPTGKIQALVVVPTRELGVQVAAEIEKIGTDLSVAAIYGGRAFEPQLAQLKEGVDILVATPGRLLDLHRQKELDLTTVSSNL